MTEKRYVKIFARFERFWHWSQALLVLVLRRLPLDTLFVGRPWLGWLNRLHDPKQGVPYGIALAAAGLLTYSNTAIFERLTA